MVNRSSILPIEKINFFPYSEDVAYLRSKYGSGAPYSSRMGYGPAMREIIHAAVKKLREKERARLDAATAEHEVSEAIREGLTKTIAVGAIEALNSQIRR